MFHWLLVVSAELVVVWCLEALPHVMYSFHCLGLSLNLIPLCLGIGLSLK